MGYASKGEKVGVELEETSIVEPTMLLTMWVIVVIMADEAAVIMALCRAIYNGCVRVSGKVVVMVVSLQKY
jgi:hypothetical protein